MLDTITDIQTVAFADFGESQIWTPAGGSATPFTGIAEVGYKEISLVSGEVISHDAAVVGKTSVLSTAKKGDAVTFTASEHGISAAAYTVTKVQHASDEWGPGFTRLVLKKA